jgi:hypothetical protein
MQPTDSYFMTAVRFVDRGRPDSMLRVLHMATYECHVKKKARDERAFEQRIETENTYWCVAGLSPA